MQAACKWLVLSLAFSLQCLSEKRVSTMDVSALVLLRVVCAGRCLESVEDAVRREK